MAAIDKIYLSLNDYIIFKNWAKTVDEDCYKRFGHSFSDYIWDLEEKDWSNNSENTRPVCNLPEYLNIWLIQRNDVPEGALKELIFNYTGAYKATSFTDNAEFDDIKLGKGKYSWKRWEYEPATKLRVDWSEWKIPKNVAGKVNKLGTCWIEFDAKSPDWIGWTWHEILYSNKGYWVNHYNEIYYPTKDKPLPDWYSSCTTIKNTSLKALVRRILKWKLPKGTILRVQPRCYPDLKIYLN